MRCFFANFWLLRDFEKEKTAEDMRYWLSPFWKSDTARKHSTIVMSFWMDEAVRKHVNFPYSIFEMRPQGAGGHQVLSNAF